MRETGQQPQLFLAGCLGMLCLGIKLAALSGLADSGGLRAAWGFFLLLSAYLSYRASRWAWLAVLAMLFLLGILRFAASDTLPESDISHWARQEVKVTGTLREEPRVTADLTGQKKIRYTVDAEKVKLLGREQAASGGLYIYCRAGETGEVPSVRIGDKLTASGTVRTPHGYQNPGQLDTKGLLRAQGITASLSAGKRGVQIAAQDGFAFARWTAGIRSHYRERMAEVMPKEDAAAIFAMLFGGYDGIRPELLESFTITGIVHILSVSGSHISLLAAVMAWLAAGLRLPKAAAAAMVLGAIAVYSVLAGCVPPVIRSAIMGGLAFLALALERERAAGHILLITGLVMLVVSPLLLFHISFQLSFLATAGLLYLAPKIRRWLKARKLPEFLAGSLAITIAAQVATLPVLAWYFNQLSLSSLLANLLVVPVIELMIVAALFAGLAALLVPFAGKLVFAADSLLLGLVSEMTRWLANLPASQIWLPSPDVLGGCFYYGGVAVCLLRQEQRAKLRTMLSSYKKILAVAGLAAVCAAVGWRYTRPPELEVHVIDVGQGDCVLVRTPGGRAFLFDTGGTRDGAFDVGARVDVPYLLHYGVRKVDAVFLTHAHEDHAGGCGSILRKMPVGKVYTADEGIQAYARAMRLGDNDPLLHKFEAAAQGSRLIADGVTIEVLYAPRSAGESLAGNEASNVYRISYGQASFLITGDLTKEKEADMLARGINPASTVLKAGHHGSDTSSSVAFLEAVAPRFAVFCVGADNSFGHPKPSVLNRYEQAGITAWRTDLDGAIVFRTDGKTLSVSTYAGKEEGKQGSGRK